VAVWNVLDGQRHSITMNYAPSSKVTVGGFAGVFTGFVLYELNNRCGITLSPEESSFITTLIAFAAAYFTPHSQQSQEQEVQKNV
jgi:hypothetical protein